MECGTNFPRRATFSSTAPSGAPGIISRTYVLNRLQIGSFGPRVQCGQRAFPPVASAVDEEGVIRRGSANDLAVRPGPATEPRCRGIGPRRDDALPRRDRGGQRGALGVRLLPREPRQDLPGRPLPLRTRASRSTRSRSSTSSTQRGELEDVGGKIRVHELAALVPAAANAAPLRAHRPRDGDAARA